MVPYTATHVAIVCSGKSAVDRLPAGVPDKSPELAVCAVSGEQESCVSTRGRESSEFLHVLECASEHCGNLETHVVHYQTIVVVNNVKSYFSVAHGNE